MRCPDMLLRVGIGGASPTNQAGAPLEKIRYLRLIDFCITQLKAQGTSRTYKESEEEDKEGANLPGIVLPHSHRAVRFRVNPKSLKPKRDVRPRPTPELHG